MQLEMKYIFEVYREGSFSAAAKKLFISQPALSMAVKRTEEALGAAIFDRGSHPLALTEAGEIYIRKVREIQLLEDELCRQLGDLTRLEAGRLRIGGTQYFNSYVLPPALARFSQRFPGVELRLTEAASDRLVELLGEGEVDLMFYCGRKDPERFTYQKVFKDHVLLAVPRDRPVNQRLAGCALTEEMVRRDFFLSPQCPGVSMRHFREEPFLLLTQGNNLHHRAFSFCRDAGFEPRVLLFLEQLVTAYRLSCNGLGAAFVSALLAKNSISPNVLYYKLDSPLATRHFNAVLRRNSYLPSAAKAFLEVMLQVYRDTSNCPDG